jgi:hypothetical protein
VIRFSWLQFRTQAAVAFGVLAVVAVVLAVTGPHLVNFYDTTVATCSVHHDCSATTTALVNTDGPLQVFTSLLLLLVPVLVGIFWGAPLVAREYETGTFRLAWTQGVTRTRWLAVKLGFGALVSMAFAGLLSLMVTWWSSPIDRVRMDPYNFLAFGARDITPLGYAAFAFVLGVTAGVLIRRTLPALATTMIGFVAARLAMIYWVRPHLIAPFHKDLAINSAPTLNIGLTQAGVQVVATTRGLDISNAWIYSSEIVDKAGYAPTTAFLNHACPFGKVSHAPNFQTCTANIAAKFHEVVTYQPGSHYWTLQWYETAIFLGLAVVLAGLSFLWIRRPLA